jgi:hypothetical protein
VFGQGNKAPGKKKSTNAFNGPKKNRILTGANRQPLKRSETFMFGPNAPGQSVGGNSNAGTNNNANGNNNRNNSVSWTISTQEQDEAREILTQLI